MGLVDDILELEEKGYKFAFANIPSCLQEWARLTLGVTNDEELVAEYHEHFWEGGTVRNLTEI